MTQNPNAGSRPSLMGDAPRLALTLLPALAAALALTLLLPGTFGFSGRLRGLAVLAGIELAAAGLLLWGSAAFELVRAWKRGRLAAHGAYALCRHPIFGWWIWSVLPALALLLDSWLLLLTAVLFWALSRPLARSEEGELTARFGDGYRRYRARTRSTLPLPLLRPLTPRRCGRAAAGLALLGAFALAVYFAAARPLLLRLGATRAEAAAALPGDEHVSRPRNLYTQAVTIGAPAGEVWKWLVQVGWRRAGWYNLDAINRLADPDYFLDGRGSSTRIHPELQGLAVGDPVHLVPQLKLTVTRLEPARLLVLAGDPARPDAPANAAWTFRLEPAGASACRLVVRFRAAFPGGFGAALLNGLVNEIGGAALQQPAMLHGLKERAEQASRKGAD